MEMVEEKWQEVQLLVKKRFDEELDVQTILFVIGLQELGMPFQPLKKEQKLDLMHIGVCTVLMPYGYYKKIGVDDDGWPHFKNVEKLPNDLTGKAQEDFMKEAIIQYFDL